MALTLNKIGIGLSVLVTAGTIGAAVSGAVAEARVEPVRTALVKHVAETKDDQGDIKRIEEKVDLLIEDCYRRGGCRR